ncbi:MAG: LamG-like jellyroll fold domain-containing protein [Chitinophagaceae bacterium]
MRSCILLLLVIVGYLANAQVNSGLISQYSFSGNANDEVGTNHGTVSGATLTTDRFNVPNKAYYFDGFNNHHISLGSSSNLKQSTMSISLWVNIDTNYCFQTALNYQPFVCTKNINSPNAWQEAYAVGYWIPGGKYLGISYLGGTQSGPEIFSSSPATFDSWHHLVYTFDNNNAQLYIDNVLIQTATKGFTTNYLQNDAVFLGITGNPTKEAYFHGKLDDIRFYNRVLNAAEVDTLFNSQGFEPNSLADQFKTNDITVYPNPLQDELVIESINFANFRKVQLTDLLGQSKTLLPSAQYNKYYLPKMTCGIYMVSIELENKQVVYRKVVKN